MEKEPEPKQNGEEAEERSGATLKSSTGFPCRNCGNQMAYSPEHGMLFCAYCKSTAEITAAEIVAPEHTYSPDSDTADAPDWEADGQISLLCPACGAETLSGAGVMTVTCPFCGSHYVNEPRTGAPLLRPETMIPFRKSQGQAASLFAKWVKRRLFAPRAFRRSKHKTAMNGVYIPYWTFDTDLSTDYSGEGGRRRTQTYWVTVNGKRQARTRTVTDWYPVHGSEEMRFDDLPCCASGGIDKKLLDKISPFSMKVLNVYNPAYLAGFFAERYNIGLRQGFASIVPVAESRMESHIRSKRGYDVYRSMRYDHSFGHTTFKHILLPVWMSSYRYAGKVYTFMVNGETGKVAGRAPLSWVKVTLTVLIVLAAAVGAVLLLGTLGEPDAYYNALPVGAPVFASLLPDGTAFSAETTPFAAPEPSAPCEED